MFWLTCRQQVDRKVRKNNLKKTESTNFSKIPLTFLGDNLISSYMLWWITSTFKCVTLLFRCCPFQNRDFHSFPWCVNEQMLPFANWFESLNLYSALTFEFLQAEPTLFQNSADTTRWIQLTQHLVKPLHTSLYCHVPAGWGLQQTTRAPGSDPNFQDCLID